MSPGPAGIIASARVPVSWTPASLPGIKVWLDPSDAGTVTLAGGKVSQLNDKSGNGYHVTQGTDAKRPTITTLGSRNALAFAGGQVLKHPASTVALGTSQTVLMVSTPASSGAGYLWTANNGADGNHLALISGFSARAFEVYADPSLFFSFRFTLATTASGHHVVGFRRDGTGTVTGRYDLTAPDSDSADNTTAVYAHYLGADADPVNSPVSATIGEVIVTNRAMDPADLALAENYLKTKWGTP